MAETIDTTAVLAQWEADEAARRKTFAKGGVARPEQVAGLTGMQFADGISPVRCPAR